MTCIYFALTKDIISVYKSRNKLKIAVFLKISNLQNRTIYLHQHKQFPNNKLTHLEHKQKKQYVICVMKE